MQGRFSEIFHKIGRINANCKVKERTVVVMKCLDAVSDRNVIETSLKSLNTFDFKS